MVVFADLPVDPRSEIAAGRQFLGARRDWISRRRGPDGENNKAIGPDHVITRPLPGRTCVIVRVRSRQPKNPRGPTYGRLGANTTPAAPGTWKKRAPGSRGRGRPNTKPGPPDPPGYTKNQRRSASKQRNFAARIRFRITRGGWRRTRQNGGVIEAYEATSAGRGSCGALHALHGESKGDIRTPQANAWRLVSRDHCMVSWAISSKNGNPPPKTINGRRWISRFGMLADHLAKRIADSLGPSSGTPGSTSRRPVAAGKRSQRNTTRGTIQRQLGGPHQGAARRNRAVAVRALLRRGGTVR